MFDKKLFGLRLSSIRTARKITQQELADVVGLKKTAISMIENGQRAASIEVIYALADYFETSIDYLVCRTDDFEKHC